MTENTAVPGFDERVRAALAAKFPELVFRCGAQATIDVLPRGGREPIAQIGLTSLSQQVAKDPEKEKDLVDAHIGKLPFSKLTESLRGTALPKPEQIYPRLVPQKRIDALPAVQRPAQMDFHLDVRVVLVAEFQYGDLYLTARDLEELKLPWPEALTKACANLARYLRASSVRAAPGPDGKPGVFIFDGHKHAAAALLLPEFPESFGGQLGEEFFVCIPAFDQLFAFRTEPKELVDHMVATAKRAYQMSDYPVTTQLFKVDPDNVTPVSLDEPDKPKIWLPGQS
jgi:hypothetical protein